MTTTINISVPHGKQVRVKKNHLDGREEMTLLQAGQHHTSIWDGVAIEFIELGTNPAEVIAAKEIQFENGENA